MRVAMTLLTFALVLAGAPQKEKKVQSLYDLTTKTLGGKEQPLSAYKGKVALVVNVASECGFTPQYAGLEKLYDNLSQKGFVVLGFPSNEFGGQEPGTPAQIQDFCSTKYGVKFPLFQKVEVKKGPHQDPVYAYLTEGRGEPKWNFHKYLVGKDGKVMAEFPSKVTPDSLELTQAIDKALAAP